MGRRARRRGPFWPRAAPGASRAATAGSPSASCTGGGATAPRRSSCLLRKGWRTAADRGAPRPGSGGGVALAVVFVVDDDPVTCEAVAAALAPEGHDIRTFERPRAALEAAREEPPAVVITDFAMPEMNGLEFVLSLREPCPDTTFLVVSGQATVEDAVSLMKHGVVDVLVKPPRARALRKALALALAQHELAAENRRLRQDLRARRRLDNVIGTSPAFTRVLRQVEKIAPSQASVLLTGETGTGKEVIAEAIHELSPRSDRRLVKVHCAAIPDTLLEAELFGHVRGAFTGAVRDRAGHFEQAHRGTIFLDEVGEISPPVQVKLLRVLQSGEIQRLGESATRRVDCRVIAATNRDLEKEVAAGRFREDLYFRLNVITLRIPPLRERGDDVLLLARHFLAREAARGARLEGFTPAAIDALCRYSWPGNVRELENVIARAAALAEGPLIDVGDLPEALRNESGREGAGRRIEEMTLAEAERHLILHALERCSGDKRAAAKRLGISLATLYRKLASYRQA
ncbi:MAG: sigma-54-dependent Fis family transcriptional regulator [Acidobacteria bacterium]|nr:MAG: sigma-54-dependent Fis family transcriptional regulator [Acidobacteriota bacterium]